MKFIGVDGSVLSICREFLSNRRQRVVVDGTLSEWIPIVSGVRQGSVLGPLLFILYTSEMFELEGNRLHGSANNFTLLAVVRNPVDRPNICASLNEDLAGFQESNNHWCIIMNPNKTMALLVSRSRTEPSSW